MVPNKRVKGFSLQDKVNSQESRKAARTLSRKIPISKNSRFFPRIAV